MIVEHRTYTFAPGKLPAFIEAYQELGHDVQVPILGNLIGVFTTEIGTLNQIIHLWGYDSLAERDRRRGELAANKDWPKYLKKAVGLIERMETQILVPAPYSPIK